jgi:hypothetical protein
MSVGYRRGSKRRTMTTYRSSVAYLPNIIIPFILCLAVISLFAPHVWFTVMMVLGAIFGVWILLNTPRSLTVTNDGRLQVRSIRKLTEYKVQDIVKIECRKDEDDDYSFLRFKFRSGGIDWQHENENDNREIIRRLSLARPSLAVEWM